MLTAGAARSTPLFLAIFAAAPGLACSEATPPAPSPPAASEAPAVVPSEIPGAATAASPATAASSANAAPSTNAAPAASVAPSPAAPPSPAASAQARIWGKSRFTWIQPVPGPQRGWTGYIGLGGSAPLKGGSLESARVTGSGGCNAWYAIEPSGFVCAGDTASVDPTDPLTAALIGDAGRADDPWPFEYGESLGAPRYTSIPSAADMRKTEWDLEPHFAKVLAAREAKSAEEVATIDKSLVGVDLSFSGRPAPQLAAVTPFVREARKLVALGSTIAWVKEFDVEYPKGEYGITKRTFLLTSDHALVPKDRVRPYPRSQFKGVFLRDTVKLPLAFFRKTPRPKYRRDEAGKMVQTGESWPARGWTMMTGEEVVSGAERYLATREEGIYASAADATVITEAAPPSGKITAAQGRGTWLDISVQGGWLVAYEKTTPVFATLISPGRGGVPFPGVDALDTASTPLGNFRVDGKFRWATMVSSTNSDIVHTDVQYVQNFHGPHALHGAYWHDVFGEPKSGGCVNLSPIDSKWVFDFTEPELPPGWHGLRSTNYSVYATIVAVHR